MRVKMINSVGEYVAGEEYDLDDETGNRFVVLGYAEGELTREVASDERSEMLNSTQTVGL